jgi:hypothetical protein
MTKPILILTVVLVSCVCSFAQQSTPYPDPELRKTVEFVRSVETGQVLAIVDGHAFSTVDSLKDWIRTLKPKTVVSLVVLRNSPNIFTESKGALEKAGEEKFITIRFRGGYL